MAGVRYRVDDAPRWGAGAFAPVATRNPVASSYGLVHVSGSPGNQPVPSPPPAAIPPDSFDARTQPSNTAPDVIRPSLYVASAANMGPEAGAGVGMTRRRLHELPVPAADPLRIPQTAMVGPHLGGREQTPWPRAFQRWPVRGARREG